MTLWPWERERYTRWLGQVEALRAARNDPFVDRSGDLAELWNLGYSPIEAETALFGSGSGPNVAQGERR